MSILRYQHESTARPINQPTVQPKILRKKSKVILLRRSVVDIPKTAILCCCMAAFVLSFLMVLRFSQISDMNYQLGELTRRHDALRETNRMLKVDIESAIVLDVVRQTAMTRFGMHEPTINQIVSVNVPKTSYSVVLDKEYISQANHAGDDLLTRVGDTVGSIVR